MRIIITILDGIVATSMPYNEFVLFRAKHYKNELQHLIICGKPMEIPQEAALDNLRIDFIGDNVLKWRSSITRIISEYKDKNYPYVIHLHQAGPSMKILLLMLGSGFSKKTVFTVHSTFSGYRLHNKIRSYIDGLLSQFVVCCSQFSLSHYPLSLKKIKGERVLAIQNGVDISRIDSIVSNCQKKVHDDVVFVYVARMVPIKNHNLILDIAHGVSGKVKFLLIGDKDDAIIRRIKEENLEGKVFYTGLVPRSKVFEMLLESDVYISTSKLEGLPVSVLEGMYVGLPAILSDIPQHREISGNSSFVKLVPSYVEEWIRVINNFLEKERDELSLMGEQSKEFVKNNFSLERMHKQYDVIYNKIY